MNFKNCFEITINDFKIVYYRIVILFMDLKIKFINYLSSCIKE